MKDLPEFVASGIDARLFPVLAETSKEKRVASIFLAVMTQIPALAQDVLGAVGVRVGKRTQVRAFTEVVLKGDSASRPDGLIVVDTGRTHWSALVEAKVGRNDLDDEQVQRYVELARANGIDAVITISNQFVARAEHSPAKVPKTMLRKVSLFHWSWPWLATSCEILGYRGDVRDSEQAYLLEQLNHFLAHPATGVERFTQMAPAWRDVSMAATRGEALKKTSPEVEEVVASWLAEERDLCLHLSSHVGRDVSVRIERKLADDPAARLKDRITSLTETCILTSCFRVPDCASDIDVSADMARRTVAVTMSVKAPTDRKSTKARVNWLLRMLPEDDERLRISALWPGRASATTLGISRLREEPEALKSENAAVVPHGFEVSLVATLGTRFSGRKTFIEDLEAIVPTFYDLVGVNLKAWQAPPPKPVKSRCDPNPGEVEAEDLEPGGALPRPDTSDV
ncbi:hypothetical protein SAMN05444004_106206 [Jannaschia faecimaris]|uniref:Stress response protein n=1 Tax=Jannaschia faecimaris TaxID=1244108 RepID=A0A1H3QM37_9RHOB|nr:hypothetical protein [Jannaschia faecimaris]SDZ14353.1 hypothetical protein SAMN05444004_106206 [Jannaschia faecimaris]